ncbi:MAG: hypothetical protein QM734_16775 [Cyclobacteriaceae bacterium]
MNRSLLLLLMLFVAYSSYSQEWNHVPYAPAVKYRFDDIYFINDTTGWAVNGNGQIYKTNQQNKPWSIQYTASQYLRSIEFIDDTTGFVGSLDSAIYMTTNAGKQWKRIDKTLGIKVSGVCGIAHLGNSVIMVGSYFGSPHVLKSYDRGKSWTHQDMSFIAGGLVDAWYKSTDTVFVSGTDASNKPIILRSSDAGANWVNLTPQSMPSVGYGWKLHFPTKSVGYLSLEEVYPSDSLSSPTTRFLKSIDGGRTWLLMDTKIGKNIDLQGLGFADANRGWIGGWSTGMYETNDGGNTWNRINDFANLNRFFFLRPDFGYVSGTSIFKFKKGVVTGVTPSEPSKDIHALEIFPNPWQNQTVAKVTLGTNTMLVLNLIDINGRTVKEIYRGHAVEGEHSYPIDLDNLTSGEYIVLMLTHEHFLSKRLLKIKN